MKKKIKKEFNVKDAQNGALVETKSGDSVRILCYDRLGPSNYPIVALINYITFEMCYSYTIDGKFCESGDDGKDLIVITEIETKFNEGDYIVSDIGNIYEITKIDEMYHTKQLSSGYEQRWTIEDIDRTFHKWSLSDAKPGSVLCCEDGRPFMLKELDSLGCPIVYFGINAMNKICEGDGSIWTYDKLRPATFIEYNNLFKQLRKENYEYDVNTHEITKKEISWRYKEDTNIDGYFIDNNSSIVSYSDWNTPTNYNVFSTKKQAKAALAMARISQIMDNDKRFGGAITDEEWNDSHWHVILRKGNNLETSIRYCYEFLAFHEKEQAQLFLKKNEDLIKDYYMMD